MKCPNPECGQSIKYTPDDILREARISGYIVKKLGACQKIYEKLYYGKSDIYLNYRLLREAIEHCICDLDRLTVFRKMDYADSHKKAAYAIKWFVKIKPIQMVVQSNQRLEMPTYTKDVAMANDNYAIIVGLSELDSFAPTMLPASYVNNLAYLLHHHSVDADFLSSEMYLLDMNLQGRNVRP